MTKVIFGNDVHHLEFWGIRGILVPNYAKAISMKMKNILVPTDFSVNSNAALDYGASLAGKIGAKLIIVHSVQIPAQTTSMLKTSSLIAKMTEQADNDLKKSEADLRTRLQERGKDIPEIELDIESGDAVDHILAVAREREADIIVMGTQGSGDFENVILGSTTAKVLKKSHRPVLAVPRNSVFHPIQKIVFATDTLEVDPPTLTHLVTWGKNFQANIEMLHVQEADNAESEAQFNENQKWAQENLDFAGITCHLKTNEDTLEGILQFMEEHEVDMVAMLPRKRGFFQNLLHSSLTRKMAMNSSIPLLALQEQD